MKSIRRFLPAAVGALFMTFGFQSAQAQFCLPATGETPLAGQTIAQNTGNDISNASGDPFEVMCWDDPANQASFGWDYGFGAQTGTQALLGNFLGPVEDPDIVLDPTGDAIISVVYRVNTGGLWRIYYEEHRYDIGTNSWVVVTPPTNVDNGFGTDCSNPNIDMQYHLKRTVITWEEANRIWGRAGVLAGGFSASSLYVSSCTGTDGEQPDVAISENDIIYTFIGDNGTRLWAWPSTYAATFAGGAAACTGVLLRSTVWPGEEFFGPRVAMIAGGPFGEVVVHYTDGAHNFIYGYNSQTGYTETQINLVCPPISMVDYGNMHPAVSWSDDEIIVVWDHDDGWNGTGPVHLGGEREVVANQLDQFGNVINCFCVSVVNTTFNPGDGTQRNPSVAGRYNWIYQDMHYFWVNDGWGSVDYKRSNYANINLKEDVAEVQAVEADVTVFPNPFNENATISVVLEEGETAQTLQVLDMTGKIVGAYNVNGMTEGTYNFQLSEISNSLTSGVYLVRFVSDRSSKTIKVSRN